MLVLWVDESEFETRSKMNGPYAYAVLFLSKLREETEDQHQAKKDTAIVWSWLLASGLVFLTVMIAVYDEFPWTALAVIALASLLVLVMWLKVIQVKERSELMRYIVENVQKGAKGE